MKSALAALLLLTLVSAARAEEAAAPPPVGGLEVPELVYDAGKIERGTMLRHAFVLRNVGSAPLSIDAKPG